MSNRLKAGLYTASTFIGGAIALIAPKAHAAALFEVPTSTVTDAMAYVTGQLADPGTLAILVAVIALGVIFYVLGRIAGLWGKRSKS